MGNCDGGGGEAVNYYARSAKGCDVLGRCEALRNGAIYCVHV